ncbi:MAG: hypothetical protein A2V90_04460 [Gammaproteobacteria bacterium RBG_16_57_12]|nr:MAG: hypothetical protein A2V90_04460 [Gammaproteobacteria bacterium RBG_16_57_12]
MSTHLNNLLVHPEFLEGTHWEIRSVAGNDYVFREGEQNNDVFIILSGTVRVLGTVDLNKDTHVSPGFSDLGEGQVFGELPLFDKQPRSASVAAVNDCELAVLHGDKLIEFLDAHPDIGYNILRGIVESLVERLRKANQRVFSLFAWGLKSSGIDQYL